jgi:phage-related protein
MIGAEATGLTRDIPKTTSQFHPATIHWQMPSGDVGWIVLRQAAKLDARAEKNQLTITATGDAMFRIAAPAAVLEQVTRDRWSLPGLVVTITTDAQSWAVVRRQNYIEVTYGAATHFILKTQP